MKKKKNIITKNYLDKIPVRASHLRWSTDDHGIVTLDIDNKGVFNKIAQVVFKRPKVSHIHLDELGSFAWTLTDGETSIYEMGGAVEERFGDKAHPLYERLAKFFQILDSYRFITWKE